MKDEAQNPRAEIENRITALLLGELTAEETAGLREIMAHDEDLTRLHDRLKKAIEFMREAAADDSSFLSREGASPEASLQPGVPSRPEMELKAGMPAQGGLAGAPKLKLGAERRERLLRSFKTVRPKEFTRPARRKMSWIYPTAVAAMFILVLSAMLVPSLSKSKAKAQRGVNYYAGRQETLPSAPAFPPPAPVAAPEHMVPQMQAVSPDSSVNLNVINGLPGNGVAEGASSADGGHMVVESKDAAALAGRTVVSGGAIVVSDEDKPTGAAFGLGAKGGGMGGGGGGAGGPAGTRIVQGINARNEAVGDETKKTPQLASDYRDAGATWNWTLNGGNTATGGMETKPGETPETIDAVRRRLDRSDDLTKNSLGALTVTTGSGRSSQAQPSQPSASAAMPGKPQEPGLSGQLAKAKVNLDEARKLRETLSAKAANEKSDAALPRSRMVEVVERAVPAKEKEESLLERIRGTGGYKSTARIKLDREPTGVQELAGSQTVVGYDPYFVQTDFEAIRSQAVLGKVAEKLKLADQWSKEGEEGKTLSSEETVALLKKKLDLRAAKGTGLLEIGVKSDKPEEAAQIANAIAETYRDQRQEERKQLAQSGAKALGLALNTADNKVAEAQQEVERLQREAAKQQLDLPIVRPGTPPPVPQPEVQARENRFSTFSLNVSDVSFKVAAASLEKGVIPDAAGIRSEEFLNAFDYRDPEPPAGVPIGFAWERAGYPFAQNRDLLRFSLKTAAQGRQAGCPLNLVLLLDNSGSMERADRVQIIREALRVLAGQLHGQDKFSVITFARTARLWVDGVSGSQAGQVAEKVSGLTPQGGTNLEEAMNLAYLTALRHYLANGINRVVLLTDGAANLGDVDPETLKRKVEEHRKQGIALDCFGIGWEGYNDDLLEVLTRNGDGRYGFINTPEEAASGFAGQLAGALQVAASDVKVQVEFNAGRVTAYRQIGYAKHQLTKEQFRDNTVDAAEIGAAESGNALYVIQVNPQGIGPLATVRARYKVPGTSDYREMEWVVPYTGTSAPLDKAGPAIRLAGSASAFAEWLASSPYAVQVAPERLLGLLSGVPQVYGADPRPKKLEWMIRQAKSIAGR